MSIIYQLCETYYMNLYCELCGVEGILFLCHFGERTRIDDLCWAAVLFLWVIDRVV